MKAVIAQGRKNPLGVLQLKVLGFLCFVTIQVLIKAACNSSLQIERGLLEHPKDESGKQITIHLGSGAFGCCNKMFYRGIPVAVKTFYSATADEVKKEARVMFKLKHLNFPLLLGVCTLSKPYLLVSSFYNVSDKPYTMYSVLQSSNLSLAKDTWLILIHQLAQAISYLHDQGFIHRDIKADNVLVSYLNQEYRAILIDFGKCTASTASGSLIKHLTPEEQEKYKRKHAHIAPEIINGSHPPSFASDVYSYGRIVCAVGAKNACDFLCALGKKCIHSDAKLRPKLIQIIEQLQSKFPWQSK